MLFARGRLTGGGRHGAYYVGVALAAGLLVYENAIISPEDLSRVNAAFFT